MSSGNNAQPIVKITNIGNSLGVIIDKKTKNYLKLQKGELVKLTIKDTQTVARIITAGNSIGVIIDKKMQELLNLKKGDLIKITIEKT